MSFEAAAWAIKQAPKLPTEKLILIALSDYHNKDTGRCDPSLLSLASIGLCSERTAMRAIDSLNKQGFISTHKELGKRTKYQLIFDRTPDTHVTRDNLSPVTPMTLTPDTHVTPPLTPMSPEPVITSNKPVIPLSKENLLDVELAEYMFSGIKNVIPKTKNPNLEKWADCIRKMRTIDGHSHRDIATVFTWANKDSFWSTNILSPSKLRDKFAVLDAKSKLGASNGKYQTANEKAAERRRATRDYARATNF